MGTGREYSQSIYKKTNEELKPRTVSRRDRILYEGKMERKRKRDEEEGQI